MSNVVRTVFVGLLACFALAQTASAGLTPTIDCYVPNGSGPNADRVYYGYTNDVLHSVEFGDQNQVVPGIGYQGQPTVFNAGTYPRVFSVVWAHVFDAVSWILGDQNALALRTAPPPVCSAGAIGPVSDVTQTSATLNAMIGIDRQSTTYHFEYARTSDATDASTPTRSVPAGRPSWQPEPLTGLAAGTSYRARLVSSDADGETTSDWITFSTAEVPAIPDPMTVTTTVTVTTPVTVATTVTAPPVTVTVPVPPRLGVSARAAPVRARQARRCPLRVAAAVAVTPTAAGTVRVSAQANGRTVGTASGPVVAGRATTVPVCLNARGRRLARPGGARRARAVRATALVVVRSGRSSARDALALVFRRR